MTARDSNRCSLTVAKLKDPIGSRKRRPAICQGRHTVSGRYWSWRKSSRSRRLEVLPRRNLLRRLRTVRKSSATSFSETANQLNDGRRTADEELKSDARRRWRRAEFQAKRTCR